jgi:predicted small secreted protein
MRKLSILAVTFLLTACTTNGGLGDIFGGGSNYPNSTYPSSTSNVTQVRGTVQYIDANQGIITVDTSYMNNLRSSQSNSYPIYFDNRTRVVYQGNSSYRPTDLERGDQVDIRGYTDNSGRFVADTITVVRNVRQ